MYYASAVRSAKQIFLRPFELKGQPNSYLNCLGNWLISVPFKFGSEEIWRMDMVCNTFLNQSLCLFKASIFWYEILAK